MILKRTDKKGNRYYVDAFTGRVVKPKYGDPLKKEPNQEISRAMSPRFSSGYDSKRLKNNIRSGIIGDYKRIMRIKPKKRDKKEFIKICKRANINPYPILDVCV